MSAAMLIFSLPAFADAQGAGVGEYTPRPPSAGSKAPGGSASATQPDALPKSVSDKLAGQPDGAALSRIATSRALGAPAAVAGQAPAPDDSDGGRSLPAAAVHSLGLGGFLLLAVVILALVFVALRSRGGRDKPAGP